VNGAPGIRELAGSVQSGAASALAVTEDRLARIAAQDGALHSFIEVFAEGARADAAAVDREVARGGVPGPLAGVPVAHKDVFFRPRRRPSCGVARAHVLPEMAPSELPGALRAAGAVELGSLNLAEFCFGITGTNATYGDVRNPCDPARITGASSSGSAAAVAAGFVDASLGTDSGGSIRVPAALCGVVGVKPTSDLLSTAGVFPMAFSLDTVGVIAATVEDCGEVLAVLGGPRPVGSAEPRIGVPRNYYLEAISPEVCAAYERSCRALEQAGAKLVELTVVESEEVRSLLRIIMKAEGAALHAGMIHEHPDSYPLPVRKFLGAGFVVTARDYIDASRYRAQLLDRCMSTVFDAVDALLTPTVPFVAPTYAEIADAADERSWRTIAELARCTQPASYLGLPAVSVPAHADAGLPVGLQLIGPPWSEARLLGLARMLEQATGTGGRRARFFLD
jgi:aspartyl-tRNA(Asn)/glutamyl-tRNA(Gln) amidotransferase subunit A